MQISQLIEQEAKRQGLSPKTIKTYQFCVNRFLGNKDPKKITKQEIHQFIDKLIEKKSGSTVNVYLNALKFFYEQVLKKNLTINIRFTKQRKRLPEFLTQEETTRLFSAINNKKHQLLIKTLYASGMRVSELVNLKVKDFQFDKDYGWVRQGKGGKDRMFIVAQKLKRELLGWIAENKLNYDNWLFPGRGYYHISVQSIQLILKKAAKEAGIKKNIHPHTLRHSFATHLLENGYAVKDVQPLLGHSSPNTTMIYLHLAAPQLLKIKSPLDLL